MIYRGDSGGGGGGGGGGDGGAVVSEGTEGRPAPAATSDYRHQPPTVTGITSGYRHPVTPSRAEPSRPDPVRPAVPAARRPPQLRHQPPQLRHRLPGGHR